ncbi:inositol monophosphatase family protein [Kitasatospora sp. NPDC004240]
MTITDIIGFPGPDPAALLEAAVAAARRAAGELTRRNPAGLGVRTKSSAYDVVTAADLAAEEVIRATLLERFPASTVIGEEGAAAGVPDRPGERGADGAGTGVRWIVDPIDGTYNFARGLPLYAISVGFEVAGRPAGGVVLDPVRDELYTALDGEFRLDGERVAPPAPSPGVAPLVLTDIPSAGVDDPAELTLFRELLDHSDVRRIGSSALMLALVAAGRADLAVNADVFVWDIAAGRTLVTASGGGFVAVPDEERTSRPGGFVAWRPGFEDLGLRVAKSLGEFSALAG